MAQRRAQLTFGLGVTSIGAGSINPGAGLLGTGADLFSVTAPDRELEKMVPTINLAIISTQLSALFLTLLLTLNRTLHTANNTGTVRALLA
jgi:hypothetical protein